MSRLKPTEVRLVRDLLLDPPEEEAEALAEAIIRALDAKRAENTVYGIWLWEPNVRVNVHYGPYGTEGAAQRAMKSLSAAGPLPARGEVFRLREIPADTPPAVRVSSKAKR